MRSLRVGHAFGIPIYLHGTFFLLPLYALFISRGESAFGVFFNLLVIASLFGCVLLHELGHALMGRVFRIETRDITLTPIGGIARLDSTGNQPHEEIAIALAGPAVNLAIMFLLTPVVVWGAWAGHVFNGKSIAAPETFAAFVAGYAFTLWLGNAILMLFNLIPAFPMDGGRVLRAVLSLGIGKLPATRVAATVGLVLAGGLAVLAVTTGNFSLLLVTAFVALAGQAELAVLRRQEYEQEVARRYATEDTPLRVEVRRDPVVVVRGGGFTGLLWDREREVWVKWVDGRPVGAA